MKNFILICATFACALLTLAAKSETAFAAGKVKVFHASDNETLSILNDAMAYFTFYDEVSESETASYVRTATLLGYSVSKLYLTGLDLSGQTPCIVGIHMKNAKGEENSFSFGVFSKENLAMFINNKNKPSVTIPRAYDRLISTCTR